MRWQQRAASWPTGGWGLGSPVQWLHRCWLPSPSASATPAGAPCLPPAWLVVQQYPTSHNYPQYNKIHNTPLILQWKMRSNCVPGKWGFAFQVLDGGYLLKIIFLWTTSHGVWDFDNRVMARRPTMCDGPTCRKGVSPSTIATHKKSSHFILFSTWPIHKPSKHH